MTDHKPIRKTAKHCGQHDRQLNSGRFAVITKQENGVRRGKLQKQGVSCRGSAESEPERAK